MSNNQKAFLDLIAFSEGTYGVGNNGYNVLVGSTPRRPILFVNYSDHPRMYNKQFNSTAAGRYQLLERWYDAYKIILDLKGFYPADQDAIALRQIRERGAIPYIDSGDIKTAMQLCRNLWASLPGAGYGQHEQNQYALLKKYDEFVKTTA